MRKLMLAMAVSGMALAAAPAIAEDAAYSSGSVVDFFLQSAQLGATRGICVGTAEECRQEALPGFDVMVAFEYNSDVLTPEAVLNLRQVATALADPRLQDAKFAIEGHTDAAGSEAYNDALSQRRALAVESFLVGEGVPVDRMTAFGLGEGSPRTADPLDPANRRVEMRIDLR